MANALLVRQSLALPTADLEAEVALCACGCAALDPDVDECQPDPERPRACRLAAYFECLANTGADDLAAERANLRPTQVAAWLEAAEAPDAPALLLAFALAARRARAKSEEAILLSAKAQSLDDGRLGLDYLRTVHPARYADRRGKGTEVNVVQANFADPEARKRALLEFALREGLVIEAEDDEESTVRKPRGFIPSG